MRGARKILLALVAIPLALGTAAAQHTAVTAPIGYVTFSVPANSFTLLGVNFERPVLAVGALESASGSTLTDAEATFTTSLTGNEAYTLKITSGRGRGMLQELVSFTDATVTTGDDISSLIAAGDTYEIRATPTLGSVFGPRNEAGLREGHASSADLIWVPSGVGTFNIYFYRTNIIISPPGWRQLGGGSADATAAAIFTTDAIFIQSQDTSDKRITVAGAVETGDTVLAIAPGFNFVSRVLPVGVSLAESGLQGDLVEGTTATADIIWNPDGAGGYRQYYVATSLPPFLTPGWRQVGGGNADASATELASGFVIQRQSGGAGNVSLQIPADLDI